jgi:hypothetical protein
MTSTLWSKAFWAGAGERAIRSFVQGGVAGLGLGYGAQAADVNVTALPSLLALPWATALTGGVVMAILSLATSIVSDNDFIAGVKNRDVNGLTPIRSSVGEIATGPLVAIHNAPAAGGSAAPLDIETTGNDNVKLPAAVGASDNVIDEPADLDPDLDDRGVES